jgi:hypothetical protein
MAMTSEEQKQYDEMKAANEKLLKELDEVKKAQSPQPAPNPQPNLPGFTDPPKPPKPSLEEQAKLNAAEQAKIAAEQKKVEETIKFNLGIAKFVDDNKDIVGENIKAIIDLAKNVKYASAFEQANELRTNILNAFFKEQSHIDALITDTYKARANEFLSLAVVVKNEQSAKYWDLFELAVENIRRDKKHEELLKKSGGQNTDEEGKEYDKKFFEMRSHYIRKKAA